MDHDWDQYLSFPSEHSGWHCKNCGASISGRESAVRPTPTTKVGGTQIPGYDAKHVFMELLTCDEVQVYMVMRS